MLPDNLGHFPNIPSTFPLQLAVNPQTTSTLKDTLAIYIYIFPLLHHIFFILTLFLTLCLSFLSRVSYMSLCSTEQRRKNITTLTFSSYSNISLGVSFAAKQSFGPLLVCSAGLLSVQQWDNYVTQSSHCVLFGPFSSRLCALISMHCLCASIVTTLSPGYSCVRTHSCTLSGQLIMDFDYSHFVLLSANGSVANRRAGRKASTIDCLSFGPN